jgi:hypothetical protein
MAVRSERAASDSNGAAAPSSSPAKPAKVRAKPAKARTRPTKERAKPAKERAEPAKALEALMPIRVHCNVGPGNRITIRGDTDPIRWDQGMDARNTAADVWEFQLERVPPGQRFQFKPLVNDTTYSTGDNYVGTVGQSLDIYPDF